MTPKIITFDCAQTLIHVDYSVAKLAKASANAVGLKPNVDQLDRYAQLHYSTIDEYWALNALRDPAKCEAYWIELTAKWMEGERYDVSLAPDMRAACLKLAFENPSIIFKLYGDVALCLNRLRQAGIRMAVISNWDYTLFRVLEMFSLDGYFEVALASRVEGVEKPDPALFEIALKQMGAKPRDVLHVGDDPVDDLQGAKNAGIRGVLIERGKPARPGVLHTLHQLEESFAWTS